MGNGALSSITIEEKWNSSSFKKFGNQCEFRVSSKRKGGIFLNIRKLDLRKDTETGDCIDYIQIKYSNDVKSDRICGKFGPEDHLMKFKSFDDKRGRVKVYISIDKFMPLDSISDNLELSLVFTSYTGKISYFQLFRIS